MSLHLYKSHLRNMILKDVEVLKSRRQKLQDMKDNLNIDAHNEKMLEKSIKEVKDEGEGESNKDIKEEVTYLKQQIQGICKQYVQMQVFSMTSFGGEMDGSSGDG